MIKNLINNKKNLIIIIVVIALVLFGLKFLLAKPTSKKIEDYILSEGYKLNTDGFYQKQISSYGKEDYESMVNLDKKTEYQVYKLDIDNFELSEEYYEYENKITYYLLANYNYKTDILDYTYRITSDSLNVIFMGEYDIKKEEFSCNKQLSYGVSLDKTEEIMCDKVKINTLIFMKYANSFLNNAEFKNYIKSYNDNKTVKEN